MNQIFLLYTNSIERAVSSIWKNYCVVLKKQFLLAPFSIHVGMHKHIHEQILCDVINTVTLRRNSNFETTLNIYESNVVECRMKKKRKQKLRRSHRTKKHNGKKYFPTFRFLVCDQLTFSGWVMSTIKTQNEMLNADIQNKLYVLEGGDVSSLNNISYSGLPKYFIFSRQKS